MSLTVSDTITPELDRLLRERLEFQQEQERLPDEAERKQATDQWMLTVKFWNKPLAKLLAELRQLKPTLFRFPPHIVPLPWLKIEASAYADELLLLLFTTGYVFAYRAVPQAIYDELLKADDQYKYYLGHLFGRYLGGRVR